MGPQQSRKRESLRLRSNGLRSSDHECGGPSASLGQKQDKPRQTNLARAIIGYAAAQGFTVGGG